MPKRKHYNPFKHQERYELEEENDAFENFDKDTVKKMKVVNIRGIAFPFPPLPSLNLTIYNRIRD